MYFHHSAAGTDNNSLVVFFFFFILHLTRSPLFHLSSIRCSDEFMRKYFCLDSFIQNFFENLSQKERKKKIGLRCRFFCRCLFLDVYILLPLFFRISLHLLLLCFRLMCGCHCLNIQYIHSSICMTTTIET